MTGVAVDIKDVRENEQVNAGYDPKSCPIQSEKIPITTIYRPDLMPDRVEGSIAPVVEYDMVSVPVSLSKFDVPGLNTEVVTLSTAVWWQPRACPRAIASASSLAADWERLLLTNSSVFEWRLIRLTADKARAIPKSAVPDGAMVDLVRRLMFRAITQAKEYPSVPMNASRAEQNDHEKGVPVHSYHDRSGIVPFQMIAGYMEREKQIMRANASEKSGKILLQTSMVDANDVITDTSAGLCPGDRQNGHEPILRVLLILID
eukprot:s7574_g5.t1